MNRGSIAAAPGTIIEGNVASATVVVPVGTSIPNVEVPSLPRRLALHGMRVTRDGCAIQHQNPMIPRKTRLGNAELSCDCPLLNLLGHRHSFFAKGTTRGNKPPLCYCIHSIKDAARLVKAILPLSIFPCYTKNMAEQTSKLGEKLLGWEFPEYPDRERSVGSWLALGVVGVVLFIIALATSNFLFAVILILVGIIYFMQARNHPRLVKFGVHEDGITLGDDEYRFEEIDRFWIVYKPGKIQNIFFHFKSNLRPYLSIPLEDTNPLRIRDMLRRYLFEDLEREEEPVTEEIARELKI